MTADILHTEPLKRRRNSILLTMTAFFWFSMYTYPSILTPYLTELGATLTQSGLVVGSYGLTQTLLRLPGGILSDRLRNKRIFVIFGMFISLISALGLFFFDDLTLILIFRALTGVAAATWVHSSTLYMSYQDAGKAPRAMGILNFINNLGQMVAMLAGSFLAQNFGWRYAFLAGAVGAAGGLAVSFFITEDRPDAASAAQVITLRNSIGIGKDRLLLWTSILALLSQVGTFATIQGFVPQYASLLGADKGQLGMLTAFSSLPRAIASLIGGGLLARYFKLRSLIVIGFILTGATTCLLPLVHSLPLLFVSQFIAGIGIGLQLTLLMSLCTQTIDPGRKASAMGFFQAVYGIGMVIGPVLIGLLADNFGLGTGFVIIGMISLMTSILAAFVLKANLEMI